ncbi:MAG TPA: hypothetical protein VF812_18425 [Ktedonobacterales bacterium]
MADEFNERASEPEIEADPVERVVEEDERYRGATPPGYDWPTHGGYLGCLLGVMTACLLAPLGYIVFGFLGAFLARPLGGVGFALAVIVTVAAYLAIFVGLTRLGWFMGRRFLREYEQPARPVWGEDDEEDYPIVVDADPVMPSNPVSAESNESRTSDSTSPQAESAS